MMQISTPMMAEVNLERMFDTFDNEPSIQMVQAHIRKSFQSQKNQIVSQKTRVRQAAWLPTFKSGFSRDVDNGKSLREKRGDANVLYNREFATWKLDLKAEWNFSELMFRREELEVQKKGQDLRGEIQDQLRLATRAYFDRREHQIILKLKGESLSPMKRLRSELAVKQLTAELDALTGGWFGKKIVDNK